MGRKKVEFNFGKTYELFMAQAKDMGLEDDMIFRAQMQEFSRLKNICDELMVGINLQGVCYKEKDSNREEKFKANPLVREYVAAHKALITTCSAIEQKLAKTPKTDNNDWL